jgi:hypothetical protein
MHRQRRSRRRVNVVTIDRPREAEAITTTLARLLRVKARYDR